VKDFINMSKTNIKTKLKRIEVMTMAGNYEDCYIDVEYVFAVCPVDSSKSLLLIRDCQQEQLTVRGNVNEVMEMLYGE
jgi:hypothetical protein